MKMRSFIALEVSDDIRKGVKDFWEDVNKCEVDVKFVEPKNLHFTLAFLGEIEDVLAERLKKALATELAGQKPFKVRMCGVRYHGKGVIRNVWLDIHEGKREFEKLSSRIRIVLKGEGLTVEEAKPHLTICRLRTQRNSASLLEVIKRNSERCFGEFMADSVALKRSELTPKGPVYNNLLVVRLK